MNAPDFRRRRRADIRWILVATGITALQAAAIFWMADRSPVEAVHPASVRHVRLAGWDLTSALSDPLLLALPTANGFAGIGWRVASDPGYSAEDWTEPVRWLGHSETNLVRVFLAAPAAGIGRGVSADKPAPQLVQRSVPRLPLAGETRVRLEGGEGDWEWEVPLAVSSITHSNVLSETVLQIATDPSGLVFSAVVLKSSGSKSADQQALALVRTARFRVTREGLPDRRWNWARLVFDWRTLAPGGPSGEASGRGT
jgi:TonB family protein